MASADTGQIAEQAVKMLLRDSDFIDDAIYSDELAQLDNEDWRDVIWELWTPELADEGGLTEAGRQQEKEIIKEAKRLYKLKRQGIKDQVESLKAGIKQGLKEG